MCSIQSNFNGVFLNVNPSPDVNLNVGYFEIIEKSDGLTEPKLIFLKVT